MNDNEISPDQDWVDPDDAPDLSTPEWQAIADATPLSYGRPRVPKQMISTTLPLETDILEHFRAGGPGWQSRINEALREAMMRS